MDVQELIEERLKFLQEQSRLHQYDFYWELKQAFTTDDAFDIHNFRKLGTVRCKPQSLLGTSGTGAERQALRRGLMKLEAAGVIQRVSRSDYRVTTPADASEQPADSG